MNHLTIAHDIMQHTVQQFDSIKHTGNINLNNISQDVDTLINQYYNGFHDSQEMRLRAYKNSQNRNGIETRMQCLYGLKMEKVILFTDPSGVFCGYPAAKMDGKFIFVESVLKDEWLPTTHVPKKVFWQMNGYMLLDGTNESILIYESRESGLIKQINVKANAGIQEAIREKMNAILEKVHSPRSTVHG